MVHEQITLKVRIVIAWGIFRMKVLNSRLICDYEKVPTETDSNEAPLLTRIVCNRGRDVDRINSSIGLLARKN